MLVGAHLRRLREERGVSRAEAGDRIRGSEWKISRMELGRVSFKPRDVADLLTLYGVTDEAERAAVLGRVKEANAKSWWYAYRDVTPDWFGRYLGLEATASVIRTYEVQFIPGLLQTEDYARAVVRLGHASASAAEIDRRVRLRMERQALLDRSDGPRLWAVIDEAALLRPVGGVEVMRDQLEALITTVRKLPRVRVQVIRLAAGGHAAAGGSFSILRFPHPDVPDVVYIEQLTGALYLHKQEDLDQYSEVVNRLAVDAEPPDRTPEILSDIIRDLRR